MEQSRGVLFLLFLAMLAVRSLATYEQLDPSQVVKDIPDIYAGISSGKPCPCCNQCGLCTRSLPPKCTCLDELLACHPSCKSCEESPKRIAPQRYRCRDLVVNYCENRCDPHQVARVD